MNDDIMKQLENMFDRVIGDLPRNITQKLREASKAIYLSDGEISILPLSQLQAYYNECNAYVNYANGLIERNLIPIGQSDYLHEMLSKHQAIMRKLSYLIENHPETQRIKAERRAAAIRELEAFPHKIAALNAEGRNARTKGEFWRVSNSFDTLADEVVKLIDADMPAEIDRFAALCNRYKYEYAGFAIEISNKEEIKRKVKRRSVLLAAWIIASVSFAAFFTFTFQAGTAQMEVLLARIFLAGFNLIPFLLQVIFQGFVKRVVALTVGVAWSIFVLSSNFASYFYLDGTLIATIASISAVIGICNLASYATVMYAKKI